VDSRVLQGILWGTSFVAACSHPEYAVDESGNIVSTHKTLFTLKTVSEFF